MRWVVLALVFLVVAAPALAGININEVTGWRMTQTDGRILLVYRIAQQTPSVCTITNIQKRETVYTEEPVPGKPFMRTTESYVFNSVDDTAFSRVTTDGRISSIFKVNSGAGAYKFDYSCQTTCGNYVCEGDEKPGNTTGSTLCPVDCGCPAVNGNPQVWVNESGTNTCKVVCPVITNAQSGFISQGCVQGYNQAVGEHQTLTQYGCQITQSQPSAQCIKCGSGIYQDETGLCLRTVIGDGVCRMDYGELPSSPDCANICTSSGGIKPECTTGSTRQCWNAKYQRTDTQTCSDSCWPSSTCAELA